MSIFDQRGQHVTYQYNAAGDINFGAVQNRAELVSELQKLKNELIAARDAQVIDLETATDTEYQITKATQQASKASPDKHIILEHIDRAKSLIESVSAMGGVVTALVKAAELAQKFF